MNKRHLAGLLFLLGVGALVYLFLFPKQKTIHYGVTPPALSRLDDVKTEVYIETLDNGSRYLRYRSEIELYGPSIAEMMLRKRIYNEILQLNYFIQSRTEEDFKTDKKVLQEDIIERKRSILQALEHLESVMFVHYHKPQIL